MDCLEKLVQGKSVEDLLSKLHPECRLRRSCEDRFDQVLPERKEWAKRGSAEAMLRKTDAGGVQKGCGRRQSGGHVVKNLVALLAKMDAEQED